MSSIGDILAGKKFAVPSEVKIIKKFVRDKFDSDVTITVQAKQIIIGCKSAALAGTLRMHSHELSELTASKKRLVFRVGG
jgi:hypothetical protein